MTNRNFGDKIKVKSFTTGELVTVLYYGKEEALTGQFEQVTCIVPPESREHFYDNKMISVLESDIVEEVYNVGDWVEFSMPGFTGCKGQITDIDENPDTSLPYRVRYVDAGGVYHYWCGTSENSMWFIVSKI